jgi:acylphosphatase
VSGVPLVARHVFATGRVQGVNFRQATANRATAGGVRGWVRNLRDGRVEAFLQGTAAAVDDVVEWMRAGGPPFGSVTDLATSDVAPDDSLRAFEIRR